ncbi:MAG: hypothetical protein RL538_34 [Candidatus Parcubacteria bacterium]|jgi:hypothetical protein
MKRALIIVVIIALLAAAYAVVAIFGTKDKTATTEPVGPVSVEGVGPADEKSFSGNGTLAELQAKGKNLECQIVVEKSGQEKIEGTYFTSGGNLRGDFVMPAAEFGGTVVSSMIVGGNSMYVWSKIGDDTFGFKSDVTDEKTKQVDTKEPVPLDETVQYTCSEWATVDGSIFIPPADVQFKDLGAVVEAGMEYGTLEGEF